MGLLSYLGEAARRGPQAGRADGPRGREGGRHAEDGWDEAGRGPDNPPDSRRAVPRGTLRGGRESLVCRAGGGMRKNDKAQSLDTEARVDAWGKDRQSRLGWA